MSFWQNLREIDGCWVLGYCGLEKFFELERRNKVEINGNKWKYWLDGWCKKPT